MSLRLTFSALKGDFAREMRAIEGPIARAATAAIRAAGADAKGEGRRNIASAGFSKKWQNALRDRYYPGRGESMNAAVQLYHKIPYAPIFETGGGVSGTPLLWLPTENVPTRRGQHRMTPSVFARTIGPLASVNVPGKAPILVAKADRGKRGRRKVTLASLRRGAAGQGNVRSVPLFIGIASVTIGDKWQLREIFQRVARRLGRYYLDALARDRS